MTNFHFDATLCAQCGGRCCQGHPGVWSDPQRFFSLFFPGKTPSASALAELLEQKHLTLRNVDRVLIPAPPENELGCSFLQETGCALEADERPCQCLALIPDLETLRDDVIHCRLLPAFGSGTARENWRPFQKLLNQAATRIKRPTVYYRTE